MSSLYMTLIRYKAPWVLYGFTQWLGINSIELEVGCEAYWYPYNSLFSSLPQLTYHCLDVKNTFSARLIVFYCSQPADFEDSIHLYFCVVWILLCMGHARYICFASYLLKFVFVEAKPDTSVFVYHHGEADVYLLLYVDNIVLRTSSPSLLCCNHYNLAARVLYIRSGWASTFCWYAWLMHVWWFAFVITSAHAWDFEPCWNVGV